MRPLILLAAAFAVSLGAGTASADPATANTQATPATTDASGATSAASQAAPAADPNEIVCRTQPPPTGTRLGSRRVCQSRANWDEQERLAQKWMRDAQKHDAGVPPHDNPGQ